MSDGGHSDHNLGQSSFGRLIDDVTSCDIRWTPSLLRKIFREHVFTTIMDRGLSVGVKSNPHSDQGQHSLHDALYYSLSDDEAHKIGMQDVGYNLRLGSYSGLDGRGLDDSSGLDSRGPRYYDPANRVLSVLPVVSFISNILGDQPYVDSWGRSYALSTLGVVQLGSEGTFSRETFLHHLCGRLVAKVIPTIVAEFIPLIATQLGATEIASNHSHESVAGIFLRYYCRYFRDSGVAPFSFDPMTCQISHREGMPYKRRCPTAHGAPFVSVKPSVIMGFGNFLQYRSQYMSHVMDGVVRRSMYYGLSVEECEDYVDRAVNGSAGGALDIASVVLPCNKIAHGLSLNALMALTRTIEHMAVVVQRVMTTVHSGSGLQGAGEDMQIDTLAIETMINGIGNMDDYRKSIVAINHQGILQGKGITDHDRYKNILVHQIIDVLTELGSPGSEFRSMFDGTQFSRLEAHLPHPLL